MGRLRQLRGEWAEAIPLLEAARPRMKDEDLVACDHALILSWIRTGRFAEAYALADRGAQGDKRFAHIYRQMRAEIDSARRNAERQSYRKNISRPDCLTLTSPESSTA